MEQLYTKIYNYILQYYLLISIFFVFIAIAVLLIDYINFIVNLNTKLSLHNKSYLNTIKQLRETNKSLIGTNRRLKQENTKTENLLAEKYEDILQYLYSLQFDTNKDKDEKIKFLIQKLEEGKLSSRAIHIPRKCSLQKKNYKT